MYSIPEFTVTDKDRIVEFIKAHPFALLTGTSKNGFPEATQLPLHVYYKNDEIYLGGHLMRNTQHHLAFSQYNKMLIVFTGPQAYISASWYTKPNVASTWNYITVYAKGEIVFSDDSETIKELKRITDEFEEPSSKASFNTMPEDYVNRMAKAVAAFEIKIDSFHAIFKLSQNHNVETRKSIINELRKRNDGDDLKLSNEMEKELNRKRNITV